MHKLSLALLTTLALQTFASASTLSPQIKDNSLIVYNANIGLVHEQRTLKVTPADTSITYAGVAKSINIDSVNVTLPKGIEINSQQYRYDKLTLSKLLEAHINKKVEVRMLRNRNEFKIITATLLSFSGTNAIVRTLDFKIITVKSSEILFSEIPAELITKPSLVWNVKVAKKQKTQMQLDYLISNISFTSNYILNIDANSSNLTGWITVNNRSGKRFENVKLSLLAGDIHTNKPAHLRHLQRVTSVMQDTKSVKHQAFEGYHFYTIPFQVTLANNEKTQIKFLEERNISIERLYTATLSNPLYLTGEHKASVTQSVKLQGLDKALPKGAVRTYAKLEKQKVLLGENFIEHTPKNIPIELNLGKNFDLKVKEFLSKREDSEKFYNVDIRYSIQNSSDEAKTLTLLIPFNRNESSSITADESYIFTQGNLIAFTLKVNANSTKKFTVNYESKK